MRKTKCQIVCLILVLLFATSTICFDTLKADASSINLSIDQTDYLIKTCNKTMNVIDLYPVELLKNCENTGIQQCLNRILKYRREIELLIDIQYLDILSLIQGNDYFDSRVGLLNIQTRKDLVISYIHETDGKKRIS